MQPAQKKFLIRFALFLVGLYALVAIQPVNDAVVVPFTGFLVKVSAGILRAVLGAGLGEAVAMLGLAGAVILSLIAVVQGPKRVAPAVLPSPDAPSPVVGVATSVAVLVW